MRKQLFAIMIFFWAVVQGMSAYPHVLITNRLTLIFDETGLKGIGVSWDFSDVFSAMIKQNFDLDRSGFLDDSEIKLVEKGAFSNLKNFNYFTLLEVNGKVQQFGAPVKFHARLDEGQVYYSFFIPFEVKAKKRKTELRISMRDETYYSEIRMRLEEPVLFENSDSYDLEYQIKKPSLDTEGWGQQTGDEVVIKFKYKKNQT